MTSNGTQFQSRRLRPLGLMAIAVAALSGCLDRPVAQTNPETNNVFVKQNPSGGIDKIDILFMIDNSLSMGDKQEVLKAAVPQLLRRLTNPDCVDPKGANATRQMDTPSNDCPTGLQREFAPVKDIHIGIVDTSLGAYGGDTCPTDGPANEPQNDHAWLLGALPRNTGLGLAPFLSWSATDASTYATAIDAKIEEFRSFVGSATELGCGNEMGLEAWYRFLVDPKPPVDVTTDGAANIRGAVDNNIVQQRQAFLRPDSLVAVFMLADENDCSMRDNTYGWVTMRAKDGFRMWRGSHVCDTNPNDPCCYSCMFDALAPDNCKSQDTTCRQLDADARLAANKDDINVRCRAMKKRYGYDFLFPPNRYVNALTKVKICPDQDYGDLDCDCAEAKKKKVPCNPGAQVDNPLFINLNPKSIPTGPMRTDASAVFLAGVVGVPWQDLAKSQDGDLEYLKASDLAKDPDGKGIRWDMFAPKIDEDYAQAQLTDPLMIESFLPRTGTHPITGEALAPPEAQRNANKINGHEWNTAEKDVQFACVFSLDVQLSSSATNATRVCDLTQYCQGLAADSDDYKRCQRRFDGCSCTLSQDPTKKESRDPTVSLTPLCQAPDGTYGSKQYYAKGYPGTRYLQVLRGFYEASGNSDNAIVGSICPKDLNYNNQKSAGYGYNPAVKALVDRLKEKLGGTCLPRKLTVQADGTVPCAIVEAIPKTAGDAWGNCTNNGRDVVSGELGSAIKGALSRDKICDGTDLPSCNDFFLCKLKELTPDSPDSAIAAAGTKCLNQVNVEKTTNPPGFCYVDPSIPGHGSEDVVTACPGTEKRIIRIVGTTADQNQQLAAPAPGKVFIACSGAAYQAEQTTATADTTAAP